MRAIRVISKINTKWTGESRAVKSGAWGACFGKWYKSLTDHSGSIKLQCEGHDVRYRNIWIKELDLGDEGTDF
jgi:hypothetical protein